MKLLRALKPHLEYVLAHGAYPIDCNVRKRIVWDEQIEAQLL